MEEIKLKLPISPKKIALILLGFVIFLVIADLVGQYYKDAYAGNELVMKIINKFDLDVESNNLPTWYQSSTLLLSSFLLALTAIVRRAAKDTDARYWAFLSAIFLYLSFDESVSIHEQLTTPLQTEFHFSGLFYLSWVVPALILLVILFFVFLRFLLRLPPPLRFAIIIAGFIYVFGAVGFEMIGGDYLEATHDLPMHMTDFRYILLTTAEEFMEMFGIVIFNYALLTNLFEPEKLVSPAEQKVAGPTEKTFGKDMTAQIQG